MTHEILFLKGAAALFLALPGCAAPAPEPPPAASARAPSPGPTGGGIIDDTSWLISAIDGDPTPLTGNLLRDDLYAVDFSGGAMLGYGGCNRFTGRYTRRGDMVTFTPIGRTRRGCQPDVMARENRLFEILALPVRIVRPDERTMLLENERGRIMLVRAGGSD